ncbi:MAG: DUF1570 domain-containing protein [Verrucomicrobia bacterium]|nr:DUF1570 domain-containing protein [Verrucomicrobiota bacterium]
MFAALCLAAVFWEGGGFGAEAAGATNSALAEHIAQLKKKAPRGFSIVEQPPFVLVGDQWPDTLQRRGTQTVKWAVDLLKKDFFERDPEEIIDIWLFKDNESYRKHTRLLFNRTPSTPYGFSLRQHHALVVNISTGGGTLVHEIVHPFLRANFPECPTWFNEGLASLYEQSGERDGHIRGETNWRLAGLQSAIRAKRLPAIEALTALSEDEFYGKAEGQNYAQARYLCYYLQEQGRLVKFYREFKADAKADPTGLASFKRVLAQPDMAAFQPQWEAFVLKLKFP